ncbi:hypothetical protein LY90DRAFT_140238 [Neocallimastix californiae]|jgi:hypothetical protein|uniref:Uncharacterized protein n=1 Tax=Neocallimastix californiae TaxID=1754190 RepID=A0A1Y2AGC3_9FUNG|nr:hypothetical protein LY90DRAFT_140238 [Neocallimastix californiae]|eukprot:ORY21629.1 hypothetical protein LY90DRAFT_140238 [Neocallimastix californiae]
MNNIKNVSINIYETDNSNHSGKSTGSSSTHPSSENSETIIINGFMNFEGKGKSDGRSGSGYSGKLHRYRFFAEVALLFYNLLTLIFTICYYIKVLLLEEDYSSFNVLSIVVIVLNLFLVFAIIKLIIEIKHNLNKNYEIKKVKVNIIHVAFIFSIFIYFYLLIVKTKKINENDDLSDTMKSVYKNLYKIVVAVIIFISLVALVVYDRIVDRYFELHHHHRKQRIFK